MTPTSPYIEFGKGILTLCKSELDLKFLCLNPGISHNAIQHIYIAKQGSKVVNFDLRLSKKKIRRYFDHFEQNSPKKLHLLAQWSSISIIYWQKNLQWITLNMSRQVSSIFSLFTVGQRAPDDRKVTKKTVRGRFVI